ncbi:MAG TPA: hypothetical protein VGU66_09170 [Candidatus Elarobacter sp.]|nr:hypothetical protein [Candidatus Elarobacter sp.]
MALVVPAGGVTAPNVTDAVAPFTAGRTKVDAAGVTASDVALDGVGDASGGQNLTAYGVSERTHEIHG